MKRYLLLLIIIPCLYSCEDDLGAKEAPVKIFVTNAIVSYAGKQFGYVSRGSILFEMGNSVEGKAIQARKGNDVIFTWYCPKEQLPDLLKKANYEVGNDTLTPNDSLMLVK